jgi:ribosomal protein S18 acetylase RimI-like enzyme
MIRAVTPQDIKAVGRLFQGVQELHATHVPQAFRRPTDEESTSAWLGPIIGSPNAYCLLAEQDGEAVGYLFAQEVRREESLIRPAIRWLILEHVAVAPSFQRQGVGTALMKALFVEAAARKIDRIELEVWSFNGQAQRFFAQHGFAVFNQRMEANVGQP